MIEYKIGIQHREIDKKPIDKELGFTRAPGKYIWLVQTDSSEKETVEMLEALSFNNWEEATYAWTVWGLFLKGETL